MDKLKILFRKYREMILYVLFGGGTTLVNIAIYWLCAHPLAVPTEVSAVIAWVASVLFAYLTNRKWVFESRVAGAAAVIKEMGAFFACRAGTGLLDVGIMYLFVTAWGFPDMPVKIASNVLVIVLNYVASKVLIFRRGD